VSDLAKARHEALRARKGKRVGRELRDAVNDRRGRMARLLVAVDAEEFQHFVRRHDVTKLLDDVLQRRAVLIVRQRRAAVRDHDDLEIKHHGIACSRLAADVGFGAADQNRIDARASQDAFQLGRARNQGAIPVLCDLDVVSIRLKPGPDLLLSGRQAFKGLRSRVVGHDVIEEQVPVAAAGTARISVQYPDDRHPHRSQILGQVVDLVDDAARLRHLGGRPGRTKCVLHVDDDKGGALLIKAVEPMITPAACKNPVNNLLSNRYVVHFALSPR
jgi:hypothetical protein